MIIVTIFCSLIFRALLEAGTLSHLTETSQDDDDDSSHMGGQLPIKLPRKQETVTSKEEYFPSSSSSDAGPGYDPPVQHEEDSHATFVDYVFQTSAQKEIGTSRTESLEHSSSSRLVQFLLSCYYCDKLDKLVNSM